MRIDTTPPSVSSDAPSGWANTPVTVTLSASDDASGVAYTQYKLDGDQSWHDTTNNQFTVAAPSDGSNDGVHTYDYRAVDNAGNESDGSCTVRIDTTGPVTTASGLQTDDHSGWTTSAQQVSLDASDAGVGMSGGSAGTYYRLGSSGPFTAYTSPFTVSGDGSHEVDYYSVDALGNTETPVNVGYVNIDTTPPTTTASGLQTDDHSGWSKTSPVSVTLSASDGESGMSGGSAGTYYRLGSSGPFTAYTSPFTVSGDGSHEVDYYSVDALGNTETTNVGWVNIDTTPPSVSSDAPSGGPTPR